MSTRVHSWPLSEPHGSSPHLQSYLFRFILALSFHLHLEVFQPESCIHFSFPPYMLHAVCISSSFIKHLIFKLMTLKEENLWENILGFYELNTFHNPSHALHQCFSTFLVLQIPFPKLPHSLWLNRIQTTIYIEGVVFFVMFLLQCGSRKCDGKSLKLAAIQNKKIKATQLADPLGTTCGPPVEEHCPKQLRHTCKLCLCSGTNASFINGQILTTFGKVTYTKICENCFRYADVLVLGTDRGKSSHIVYFISWTEVWLVVSTNSDRIKMKKEIHSYMEYKKQLFCKEHKYKQQLKA
jgi:hypothetical protein